MGDSIETAPVTWLISYRSGPIPTDAVPDASGSPPASTSGPNFVTRVIVACVLSVFVTLVLVGAFYLVRRIRRRRQAAAALSTSFPSGKTGRVEPFNSLSSPRSDTQLDLIASRSREDRTLRRLVLDPVAGASHSETGSPVREDLPSPSSSNDPFRTPAERAGFAYPLSDIAGYANAPGPEYVESPTSFSPVHDRPVALGGRMARENSTEALLAGHGQPFISNSRTQTSTPTGAPSSPVSGFNSSYPTLSSRGRLALHDALNSPVNGGATGASTLHSPRYEDDIDLPDLKRETLAYLDQDREPVQRGMPSGRGGSSRRADQQPQSGFGGGRRRTAPRETETEYVLHRDAGRAVMELPPRYDEVNWEGDGESGDLGGVNQVSETDNRRV